MTQLKDHVTVSEYSAISEKDIAHFVYFILDKYNKKVIYDLYENVSILDVYWDHILNMFRFNSVIHIKKKSVLQNLAFLNKMNKKDIIE